MYLDWHLWENQLPAFQPSRIGLLAPNRLVRCQRVEIKIYIKKEQTKKISYDRRDYEAAAEKQQFNTARSKEPPPVIQEVTVKIAHPVSPWYLK